MKNTNKVIFLSVKLLPSFAHMLPQYVHTVQQESKNSFHSILPPCSLCLLCSPASQFNSGSISVITSATLDWKMHGF